MSEHAGPISGRAGLTLRADEIPFEPMLCAFRQAAERERAVHDYRIAGFPVRFETVGERLTLEVTQALAHLETSLTSDPALTVALWDESAVGVPGPPNGVPMLDGVQLSMHASEDGRFVMERRPHGTAILDRTANRIVACMHRAAARNLDERARPTHRLLATWLNDRSIQFVHAGLVRVNGRGILFGGHGGAGKSTCSIATLCAGHLFLSDDFIGLAPGSAGRFVGYGLFASGLLDVDHIRRFPELEQHAHPPNHPSREHKAVVYLNALYPGALPHETPIDALVLPRIAGTGATSFEPVSKSQALLAMAPSSVMLLPAPNAAALQSLADLVQSVPCYNLYLGDGVRQIAPTVERIAETLVTLE